MQLTENVSSQTNRFLQIFPEQQIQDEQISLPRDIPSNEGEYYDIDTIKEETKCIDDERG
jgi:hypothetical protein